MAHGGIGPYADPALPGLMVNAKNIFASLLIGLTLTNVALAERLETELFRTLTNKLRGELTVQISDFKCVKPFRAENYSLEFQGKGHEPIHINPIAGKKIVLENRLPKAKYQVKLINHLRKRVEAKKSFVFNGADMKIILSPQCD
jgi:hypothetical protein